MLYAEQEMVENEENAEAKKHQPTRVDGVGLIAAAGLGRRASELSESLGQRHAVRTFRRLKAAAEAIQVLEPDTVVVGYSEGVSGAHDLVVTARQHGVPVVLALIDSHDEKAVDHALLAGAHDVVPPPHSAEEILLRRRVLMRTRSPSGDAAEFVSRHVALGPLTIDLTMRQVIDGDEPLTLTGREFELLVRLMQDQGEIVPRERLIEDIWGRDKGSEAVLDATVHRLRRKLKEKVDDEELLTTVRGVGYRIRPGSFRTPLAV